MQGSNLAPRVAALAVVALAVIALATPVLATDLVDAPLADGSSAPPMALFSSQGCLGVPGIGLVCVF
jgi:hypothetical protein